MPTSFPTIPAKYRNETGHVALHASQKAWMDAGAAAINALEAGGTSHTHAAADIASGTLNLARMPAGSTIVVDKVKNGGTWPARPTARTDVTVEWVGPDDPGSAAINGDEWSQTP